MPKRKATLAQLPISRLEDCYLLRKMGAVEGILRQEAKPHFYQAKEEEGYTTATAVAIIGTRSLLQGQSISSSNSNLCFQAIPHRTQGLNRGAVSTTTTLRRVLNVRPTFPLHHSQTSQHRLSGAFPLQPCRRLRHRVLMITLKTFTPAIECLGGFETGAFS